MATLLLDRAQLEVKSEGETLALYEAGTRRGTTWFICTAPPSKPCINDGVSLRERP
jgi:hypothetical protein